MVENQNLISKSFYVLLQPFIKAVKIIDLNFYLQEYIDFGLPLLETPPSSLESSDFEDQQEYLLGPVE